MANFLPVITFNGIVHTGYSCGKFFVELPWVLLQLKTLTGITPYFGTLNLCLTGENIKQRACLTPQNGVMIKPEKGYLPGYLFKAKIFDTVCYVILPDVPNYPKDLIEIIAAVNLRNRFNIKDGDLITVSVSLQT